MSVETITLNAMTMLERLHPDSFDYSTWHARDKKEFVPAMRYELIVNKAYLFRRYAIGYLEGERSTCRPKLKEVAVMFRIDEIEFWFHMRKNEFEKVFDIKL